MHPQSASRAPGRAMPAAQIFMHPDDAGSRGLQRNDLAWVLATSKDADLRDGARAVELAESVVEGVPTPHPLVLDTLAAAYAESGRACSRALPAPAARR